jgi:hypothetical protein
MFRILVRLAFALAAKKSQLVPAGADTGGVRHPPGWQQAEFCQFGNERENSQGVVTSVTAFDIAAAVC